MLLAGCSCRETPEDLGERLTRECLSIIRAASKMNIDAKTDATMRELRNVRDRMLSMPGPRYAFVAKIGSVKAYRGVVPSEGGADVERAGWVAEGKCSRASEDSTG
jgi:hypothetical protein